MKLKRPFTNKEFQSIPIPIQEYIVQLEELVLQLYQETQDLKKRVLELENQVKQNSQNSSKPPSSDPPYKKPKKQVKKSKRKRGAQKGHKGHRQELMLPKSENNIIPKKCRCGGFVPPESLKPFYTHQVIELPKIDMDVKHFILHKGVCSRCGCWVKSKLPKEHEAGYGPRLSALIAEVSGIQGNSRQTVRTLCKSVFGFSISTGAIQKVIDRASKALEPVHEKIGKLAHTSRINYIDETSWLNQGKSNWIWVMTNNSVAYFIIHPNRSKLAFQELIQDWKGILVSDNYGVYVKWVNLRQSCLAHLIRKAKGLAEDKDSKTKKFGKQLTKDLQLLCHWAKEFPDNEEWLNWYQRFTTLIFDHQKDKKPIGPLARSLIRQIESLWLFLDIVELEPTNNIAERVLRYGVLWRKRCKGSQSLKGNRWVERILSFKQTCTLRKLDSFPILTDLLTSHFKKLQPDLSWL